MGYLEVGESQIPWIRRRELGSTRAYFKTVFLTAFRFRRFCAEYFHPQDYAAANRFRWITSALAAITVLTLALPRLGPPDIFRFFNTAELCASLVVAPVVLMAFFAAAVQVSGLFFQLPRLPAEQQHRGTALSLYACGPLGLGLPLSVLFLAGEWAAWSCGLGQEEMTFQGLRLITPLATWAWWWLLLMRMGDRLHRREGWAMTRMILGLFGLWALMGLVFLVGVPAVMVWLALVVVSLM